MKVCEVYRQVKLSTLYLAKWRMNIKEKGAVNIIAAHLPKVGLIPAVNEPQISSDLKKKKNAYSKIVIISFSSPHVRRLRELVEAGAHGQKQHREDRTH